MLARTAEYKSLGEVLSSSYPLEIEDILKRTKLTWAAMPQIVCFRILLGVSLVWPKASVFEIVITGSNPVPSANKLSVCSVNLVDGHPWKMVAGSSSLPTQTNNLMRFGVMVNTRRKFILTRIQTALHSIPSEGRDRGSNPWGATKYTQFVYR